jgi:hypothetical protein
MLRFQVPWFFNCVYTLWFFLYISYYKTYTFMEQFNEQKPLLKRTPNSNEVMPFVGRWFYNGTRKPFVKLAWHFKTIPLLFHQLKFQLLCQFAIFLQGTLRPKSPGSLSAENMLWMQLNVWIWKNVFLLLHSLRHHSVSKRALQLRKSMQIYSEDINNVLKCQNVAKHIKFYLG